jgi:hypothetical protein
VTLLHFQSLFSFKSPAYFEKSTNTDLQSHSSFQ